MEKIHDGNLLDDPMLAAGTLPGFYVESDRGRRARRWPLPLPEHYAWDAAHLPNTPGSPRPRKASRNISTACLCKAAA